MAYSLNNSSRSRVKLSASLIKTFFVVLTLLCLGLNASDTRLLCRNQYYFDVNERALVSCEYDRSFLTVRWYYGGSDKSFLRYDGESLQKRGSGYDSGEFDITEDGSMVIKQTRAKHEGTYKISVLHSDGSSSQESISIFIFVPLESLKVQDCCSELKDLCNEAQAEVGVCALVCKAEGAQPPVDLIWQTIGLKNITLDHRNRILTTQKSSNTSVSTFYYRKDIFPLQIFSCVPYGAAANDKMSAAILIKGDAPSRSEKENKYVHQGSPLHIQCPTHSLPFAQLVVAYEDKRELLLMETNAYTLQEYCLDESCRVERNSVQFEKISYVQEGDYICTSSDGTQAIETVTRITVLIEPENATVDIKGCGTSRECSRNANRTGSLTCYALKFRPQAELVLIKDADSNLDVKLTNERRRTKSDPVSGTSDSYLTVDYEIMECGDKASLTCSALQTNFPHTITPTTILLVRDQQQCSLNDGEESGGSTIVIVVIIVVIIVIVLASLSFILACKKGKIPLRGRTTEDPEKGPSDQDETVTDGKGEPSAENYNLRNVIVEKPSDQEQTITDETGQPSAEAVNLLDKTVEKKSKIPAKKPKEKTKTKRKKETKPKSTKAQKKKEAKLQAEFNKSVGAILGTGSETKPMMDEDEKQNLFQEALQKFADKNEVTTGHFLGVFIEGSTLEEQDLNIILKCVPLEVVNELISVSDMVDIFHKISETKQVSDSCLESAQQEYHKGTITARDFAKITSPLRGSLQRLEDLIKIVKDSTTVEVSQNEGRRKKKKKGGKKEKNEKKMKEKKNKNGSFCSASALRLL